MAAKLKKRALAEYQSQVLTSDTDNTKRLKLLLRGSPSIEGLKDPFLSLDSSSTSREILENLTTFMAKLPTLPLDRLQSAIRKISELLSREKDSSIRGKLVLAWGRIVATGKLEDTLAELDELVVLLNSDTVDKETSALLTSVRLVVDQVSLTGAYRQKIYDMTRSVLLSSSCSTIHCRALELLAGLVFTDDSSVANSVCTSVLQLCGSFSMSQDARVRTAAFHGLLTIHEKGVKLDVAMYGQYCTALSDDYEGVRCEVLKLIGVLAETEPEYEVSVEGGREGQDKIRLVDDVFSKVCQGINDLNVQVRELAADMIGSIRGVSQTFLEQTLDKKLMSNMRAKKTAHERQAALVTSGEWSSGKKWADDAPKEEVDARQINLVSMGSCGAFVHGLEDEFLSVRSITVESLTKLSVNNPTLAIIALDFLVDMFNDEIEQVRLKAIDALTAIAQHIKLQVHQLEIILSALDDYSTIVREKLHIMLQSSSIATKDGLKMVITKLLTNLKRYPQDKRSILNTFKCLGANHPDLTLPLVTSLLDIHPFFDRAEPDIEDTSYLCTLVLILNAAQHSPTLLPLLDSHTRRHHSYLQDTFPDLIPAQNNNPKTAIELGRTSSFLQGVLARVVAAGHTPSSRQLAVLSTATKELDRLASIDPVLRDPATFAHTYMTAQALFLRVIGSSCWTQSHVSATQQAQAVRNHINNLTSLSLKLQSMFSQLDASNSTAVQMLELKVKAVNLVYIVCGSNLSALIPTEAFLKEFSSIRSSMTEEEISKEPFLVALVQSLNTTESKPGVIARILRPLLVSHPPAPLTTLPSTLAMAHAVIHEPSGGQETPHKYMAGLVLGIQMDARIDNVQDIAALRICVCTGDQQIQLAIPRRGDLMKIGENKYRLLTTALLSHQVWSEPLDVDLSLVLDLTHTGKKREKATRDNIVHLCKPVKVNVLPKPIRRGI